MINEWRFIRGVAQLWWLCVRACVRVCDPVKKCPFILWAYLSADLLIGVYLKRFLQVETTVGGVAYLNFFFL